MGMGLDSGDCSQRICPFEFAWVDTPDKLGNHHRYAECSNRGICDRDSGECECFPGYEGKACARTTCPNDCSGHGRCKYIEDLPFQSTPQQFDDGSFFPQKAKTFGDAYKNWDASKTRGCQCDPEWGDVDCSKRMCQHGNDIMDQRDNLNNPQKLHVQHIQFVQDWHYTKFYHVDSGIVETSPESDANRALMHGRTFALTFTSKLNETFTTIPIVMPASDGVGDMRNFFLDVEHALEALPNGVIDNVKVNGDLRISSWENGALQPWRADPTTDSQFLRGSGGSGSGALFYAYVTEGAIDKVVCVDGGSGYADGDSVTMVFAGQTITLAVASAGLTDSTITPGVVTAETTGSATTEGYYGVKPLTSTSNGSGTGALFYVIVDGDGLDKVVAVAGGSGYADGNEVYIVIDGETLTFTIDGGTHIVDTDAITTDSDLKAAVAGYANAKAGTYGVQLGYGDTNMEISDQSAFETGNGALDGGEADADALYINITFHGKNVQGPQNLLTVKHIACADGCTPKLTGLDLRYDTMNVTEIYQADYNSYECGRRGKCDYKTGICECFSGYSGLSCGTITSLV